ADGQNADEPDHMSRHRTKLFPHFLLLLFLKSGRSKWNVARSCLLSLLRNRPSDETVPQIQFSVNSITCPSGSRTRKPRWKPSDPSGIATTPEEIKGALPFRRVRAPEPPAAIISRVWWQTSSLQCSAAGKARP